MDKLIDEKGYVYRQGWDGQWHRQQGIFGAERETDFFGNPSIQHSLFEHPVSARTVWGSQIYSSDGAPLYQPSSSTASSSGGGSSGGDALVGLAALGLIILAVIAVATLFSLFFKLISAIANGYCSLMERYPRAMLVFHLLKGMAFIGGVLWLAGFPMVVQLAGAGVVPLIWGWLRLTRRLPLIFMPINCAIAGAGLWFAAEMTRPSWETAWGRLSAGIPLLENLPVVLAALPMSLWLWKLGARRFPRPFLILDKLVTGGLLLFVLFRVWTGWQPYWIMFVAPVPPLIALTGWLILLLPLGLWLWRQGQARWPLVFTALNLLVFGGLLGLTAYHTRPAWIDIWRHWMAGMPFVSTLILAISLAPVAFWGWGLAVHTWRRWLAIPNALLTGGILWLILDRTRDLWARYWQLFWGSVPLQFDPALALLAAPLLIWAWRKGAARWPDYWGAPRAILWGGIFWWLAERTRLYWMPGWLQFAGSSAPDPALVLLLAIPVAWGWKRLGRRWPRLFAVLDWGLFVLLLYWLVGRLFPYSALAFRGGVALAPLVTYAWFLLLQRRALIALALVGMTISAALLLHAFAPHVWQNMLGAFSGWLRSQGPLFWFLPVG